jgi:3',5'-cyclic AMP phosphodiesterase CpdA
MAVVMLAMVAAWWGPGQGTARGGEPFTFVQLCDPQLGMGEYELDVKAFEQAVARVNELRPDFAVICGDLVHHAEDQAFADVKRIKAGLKVPCYWVPGNHDVGGTPTQASLVRYREMLGKDYFSMTHGGHVFVFVNTQLWKAPVEGASKKQDAWLRQTLETAAAEGAPVVVVGHYPLFLEQPEEAEEYMNLPVAKRKELLDLFERCGVVAVLGGHTHRLIVNEYKGIQLVNGETTSKNFDGRPRGFRWWEVTRGGGLEHRFVGLNEPGGA